MNGPLLLAWRHLCYHKTRTALLVAATVLAAFFPIVVERIVSRYGLQLRERASSTPLLLGAKGSRYDLAIAALYFRGRVPDPIPYSRVDQVMESDYALAIPLALGRSAQGRPLVGTSLDYFDFRKLHLSDGAPFAIVGEAVLGATVAAELGLRVGDAILSDRGNVYDLAMAYPLRMRVTGVLAPTSGPDDGAVFVDVKTAWIVDGIGHGHATREEAKPDEVLSQGEGNVAFNAALVEYVEITPENLSSFHFHGDPREFPLSAVICDPRSEKSATLLKGRYRIDETSQILEPSLAIEEILGFVFQLKRFFDLNVALVSIATLLFLALVVLLSLRVREREILTLEKIGASRAAIGWMLGFELAITLGAGLAFASLVAHLAASTLAGFVLSF